MRSIYSHILPDGTNIHIDAQAVRRCLLSMEARGEHPVRCAVHLDPAQFWQMLERRQFDPLRCIELARRSDAGWGEPLIWGLWGNMPLGNTLSGFLMDGHHRYALATVRGLDTYPVWPVPESAWRLFEIHGLPSLTQDELDALSPTQRSY